MAENLEKFRSNEHYGADLEGSTIFLCRSSTCRMSIESCRLAELKYAFFRRTGRKNKKLPHSKLFLCTVLKHGLLEGSTIFPQWRAITRTPFKSSPLGELKYAISAGWDVRLKNKSIGKCKKMTSRDGRTWSLYCGLAQTSSDKFEQVRTRVKRYFSSTVSCTLFKFGPPPNLRAVF